MNISFRIGELAEAAQTSAETIRYYEKIGLLSAPSRTGGNYRSFGERDLARLLFVRRARDLGFSIDQIRTLLNLADQREQDCCRVDAMTREHMEMIEQKIADLTALKLQLSSMLTSCQGGKVADCRILDALDPAVSMSPIPALAGRVRSTSRASSK